MATISQEHLQSKVEPLEDDVKWENSTWHFIWTLILAFPKFGISLPHWNRVKIFRGQPYFSFFKLKLQYKPFRKWCFIDTHISRFSKLNISFNYCVVINGWLLILWIFSQVIKDINHVEEMVSRSFIIFWWSNKFWSYLRHLKFFSPYPVTH